MARRKQKARLLEESDLIWLQQRFQRLHVQHPDLTLEAFALQHGVDPALIRPVESRKNVLRLYHGTTKDRAAQILQEGFRCKRGRGRLLWFTSQHTFAQKVALVRSRSRGEPPVVFECVLDLAKYENYERKGPLVYAFNHECIPSEVILRPRRIKEMKEVARADPRLEKRREPSDLPDVCLTPQSGRTGIVYWLNSYLHLEGDEVFPPDAPIVIELEAAMNVLYDDTRERLSPREIAQIVQEFLKEEHLERRYGHQSAERRLLGPF